MADSFWEDRLAGLESTTFPDLTGKSPSARRDLSGFHSSEQVLRLDGTTRNEVTPSICIATCAKILALYLEEHDFCIDYLPPTNDSTDHPDTPWPIRIASEGSRSNREIVFAIENALETAARYGPPSHDVLQTIFEASNASASDVLVTGGGSAPRSALTLGRYQKYSCIFEFGRLDADDTATASVKLHCRNDLLNIDDASHVLAACQEAFLSLLDQESSPFRSWSSNVSLEWSQSDADFETADYSDKSTVHAAFEKHAAERPDDVALDFLEDGWTRTTWTFSTLNSLADLIAKKLVDDHDLQLEDSVPICVSKSPAFYACILGVLKAGGVFTPFSGSPSERKKFMLEELGAKVLLYSESEDISWAPDTPKLNVTSTLKGCTQPISGEKSGIQSHVLGSNLCYQMYTSGSTGRPKAVSLEHKNAVQTARATKTLIPWTPKSRLLQQAGVTFDMCYFETFFAWNTGIRLCSASDDSIYNNLTEVINDMDIDLLGLTPSVALTVDPLQVPSIRWLYCIGEALPQSLVEAWEGRLVNSYGPTEAAQMVTLFPTRKNVKSTIIGKPFENTLFVVLQKNSTEKVPILGVGELCIGGLQIARGYYKNPEKTEQSFTIVDGRRLYRTGDLVRMLADHNFEFIGRIDDQIKVRGQRVELGEINKALEESHSGIQRACTQILKISDYSKPQLVTFLVVGDRTSASSQQEIRTVAESHLSDVLPPYMIPKLILFIDSIPLSLAGKVDKRALTRKLRESDQLNTSSSSKIKVSTQGTNQRLRQIYSSFCGTAPNEIGLDTSIYQLGIDSITAIQIAHELRATGSEVRPGDVMTHSTISQLSQFIDDHHISYKNRSEECDLAFDFDAYDRKHRSEILQRCNLQGTRVAFVRPATPLQTGMILQSTQTSESLYFNHLTYRLPRKVDLQRFHDAWDALFSRHEILRSGFVHLDITDHPVAMITYYARSIPLPVQYAADISQDLGSLRSQFIQSAVQDIHVPPWKVLVSRELDRFYLSIHHALYDAQVLEILTRDLTLAYEGLRLPIYRSIEPYIAEILGGSENIKSSIQFWQGYGKCVAASKFPILNPLFEEKSQRLQVTTIASPLPLSELERGCRDRGISMQSAAQAAWGLLLGYLTGEDTVTFGTVLSGRIVENSEDVSFPMITTLPTVVNCRKAPANVVQGLMKFNAEVQTHQFVPLNKIRQFMGYSGETLFDTIFTFQKRLPIQAKSDVKFEFLENDLTVEYPVSIEVEPTESGRLEVSVFYESSYMRAEQAKLVVDQFHFLLRHIISGDVSQLSFDIGIADPRLFSIIPAKREFLQSDHSLLHHAVEITAKNNPEKVALEFVIEFEGPKHKKQCWTFRQLDEEGNKIAHLLRRRQIKQGSIVAICFDKCPEAAFTMLGISKAGCAFLALDPGAPFERKKFIMEDSQASLLLTNSSVAKSLPPVLSNMIVDMKTEKIDRYPSKPVQLDRQIDPQEMAYCLYTSGTTGTPKGCVITHENVIQVLLCFEKLYAYAETSRWLQFASYHFDVSVMEHFWSWLVGMTVVKASRDLVLRDLSHTISALQITHIDLTPSLARLLDPQDVPTLADGVFVTGGEMLRQDIIEAWGNCGAIHNAYGPTEATIGVTMYRRVPRNGRPSNIGWPFDVVGILIVQPYDPDLPVMRGGVGELLITGKLVAKGYLHRDELTRQRFIKVGGQRCYRTGDLARVLSDGSIEILGRADDQVKLRGQRLETGEINSVIKQGDGSVDDVSTFVLKHPKQQKEQLVSFVSVREHRTPNELALCTSKQVTELIPKLRSACTAKLPGYMVPTHILMVNRLPLSANNKVEGRKLKALYESTDMRVLQDLMKEQDNSTSDTASGMDLRQISAVLCKSVGVNVADISPSSNFFELGLDSISVINFSRSLREAGYTVASPSLIMKHATLSMLAAALASSKSDVTDGSVQSAIQKIVAFSQQYKALAALTLNIEHRDIETIMPCTALQAGMISRSLESSSGLYFTAFNFQLVEDVDIPKLRDACQRVCDHVQMLRTKFIPTEDGYIQVVLRKIKIAWLEIKADAEDATTRLLQNAHRAWWKSNSNEIQQPFELLITKTPARYILTLHIFHALYDGNSLPLIMNAVVNEYHNGLTQVYGPPFSDVLPHGPLRHTKGAEDFWKQHLSVLSEGIASNLKPLSMGKVQKSYCINHRIEPVQGFEECRRKLNVTHQTMMQACWSVLIQDVMRGPLVLGMIVSGRSVEFEGINEVIGPLFNTIPFLLVLSREDSWRSVIARSHEFNTAVLSYQHTPLRDIQRWTRSRRNEGPLFETLFVFQKEPHQIHGQSPPWTLLDETFEADYPLAFEIEQTHDGGFNLTLACQPHILDPEASEDLLKRFEDMLSFMVGNIDIPLIKVTENKIDVEHLRRNSVSNSKVNGSNKTNENGVMNDGSHTAINGNGIGHSTHANGNGATVSSKTVQVVRKEIASLAEISQQDVHGNTSIFEVGLDSIDAVKLSSRLKKATGVQLPVSKIMRLLTLDNISAAIENKHTLRRQENEDYSLELVSESINGSLKNAGVNLSDVERVLPCTPLQEGMVSDMRNSGFERYLNFDVLEISQKTDITILKAAWRKAIEIYPILRSRFVDVTDPEIDCTIAQLILRLPKFEFGDIVAPGEDNFSQIYSTIREDVKRTFDDRPALRLVFVKHRADATPSHLVLSLAHAMYDGWSLGLVHEAVHKLYHRISVEAVNYEPALSKILSSLGERSQEFWRNRLADTKVTILPKQRMNSPAVHRMQRFSRLPWKDVLSFCRHYKITVAALCQSVWSIVLAHRTKQLNVSYAQVLSGRTDETTSEVVFPTMNTVISHVVLHGKRYEIVQHIQESLSAMSEHQHFPLRKALALASSSRAKDMLNTLFIFQKAASESTDDKTQLYKSIDSASNVEYSVCVEAEVSKQHLIWRTACEDSYLDADETDVLLQDLDNVLEAVIWKPEEPVMYPSGTQIQLCNLPSVNISVQSGTTTSPPAKKVELKNEDGEWSLVEQILRNTIADVAKLDVNEVSKSSSLFALGLDSISTIKVSSLLRRQGVRISVNELLAAGSIRKIAEFGEIDRSNESEESQSGLASNLRAQINSVKAQQNLLQDIDVPQLLRANKIDSDNVEQILPTTTGQALLLSRWQNEGVYYSSLDFSAYGCKDIKSLHSAWFALCKYSPMLRTIFLATGSHECPIVQVTLTNLQPQFFEVAAGSSLEHEANHKKTEALQTLVAPCALFAKKIAEGDFQLALKISHALYDGFSLKMLISTLQQLLNEGNISPALDSKQAFSTYLTNTASSSSKRRFWTNYLSNLKISSLSQKRPQDVLPVKQIHIVRANVLKNLSTLRDHARKNQVSIQSLLLASYSVSHAYMLRRSASNDNDIQDILVGIFMANRNTEGADELEAPTLGFAPVRVKNPLTRSTLEIARDIQTDMREISEDGHGQVGLWELQDWIGDHVKVDVWVNILRQWLPDQQSSKDKSGGVQVMTGEKSESLQREYEITRRDEDVEHGLLLKGNRVRGCYDYPMMDLEATVKEDNLDIGIQAPTTLVGFDEARGIIEDVAGRLDGLVG